MSEDREDPNYSNVLSELSNPPKKEELIEKIRRAIESIKDLPPPRPQPEIVPPRVYEAGRRAGVIAEDGTIPDYVAWTEFLCSYEWPD